MFPLVHNACVVTFIPIIIEHLTCLQNRIEEYVPSISTEFFSWIRNPYLNLAIANSLSFELCEEEELADISSARGLKLQHTQLPLDTFFISVMEE